MYIRLRKKSSTDSGSYQWDALRWNAWIKTTYNTAGFGVWTWWDTRECWRFRRFNIRIQFFMIEFEGWFRIELGEK